MKKQALSYAKKGALLIGIPFSLWAIFISFNLCSTCGSVFSFGIVVPSILLGFPWGLGWLYLLTLLQNIYGESFIPMPFMILGFVLSVSLNGAIAGYIWRRRVQ